MKKFAQSMLALLSLAALSVGAAAFAEESPYQTYSITLEANPAQTQVDPLVAAPVTKDMVAFHVVNNTGKTVYFVNGEEKSYIPLVSQNTVTVPYAKQDFKIVDAAGNALVSWHLGPYEAITADVESATQAEFTQWGQQLDQVIASAQNRTVSYAYQKQEPAYSSRSKYNSGETVRGYW